MKARQVRSGRRSRHAAGIQSVITLLNNSEAYKEQLDKLERLRIDALGKIDAWGQIEDIEKILARAHETEIYSEELVEKAKKTASSSLKAANTRIRNKEAELSEKIRLHTQSEATLTKAWRRWGQEDVRIKELIRLVALREQNCLVREAKADSVQHVYESKLKRIRKAMAD